MIRENADGVKPDKSWRSMSGDERRGRLAEILAALDRRQQAEPIPRTTGDFWKSSEYLKRAAVFAYSVLGGN